MAAHAYAVEIDRAGDTCLAFYYGATCDPWEAWIRSKLPTWKQEQGTYTDLATICPATGLCGVNFAAGYLYQHTRQEMLSVDALERSLAGVRKLIRSAPKTHLSPERSRLTANAYGLGAGADYGAEWDSFAEEWTDPKTGDVWLFPSGPDALPVRIDPSNRPSTALQRLLDSESSF